jgi:hypothetical protein
MFVTLLIWLLFLPAAIAQKRVRASVNPNADIVNGSADLYVPQDNVFTQPTGDLLTAREEHTAVALNDGKVLVAGGRNNRYLKSAEIFNPATGLFTVNYQTVFSAITGLDTTTEGSMKTARSGAAGILLLNGKVLIAGGFNGNYLSDSETYDPATGEFNYTTGAMKEARYRPTVTLMSDGRVLLTGGVNTTFLVSAEIYNPFTNTFILTSSMSTARARHTATRLSDGKILVVGGCANTESNRMVCDNYLKSAEIYDPVEGTFEDTGELNEARAEHSASLLPDGRVLIAGGTDGNAVLATAEIYDPETGAFTYTNRMGIARKEHTATVMSNGRILLAGGYSGGYLSNAEIFDPSVGAFSAVASSMSAPRLGHAATVLSDGRVLITGGLNSDLLVFDVNERVSSDNVAPNIVFSSDSQIGFVPYAGSGVVVAFSTTTGEVLARIATGGEPAFITPLPDGNTLAVVSVFDNRIFLISMDALSLQDTFTFEDAQFGFGSLLTLSPDGSRGYISSTGTGEVIQFDMTTGNELKRLGGLDLPAQVTVTPDGNTLMVVETGTAVISFVDTESMNVKFVLTFRSEYDTAAFTIYNKVVLSPDGEYGIICSQDYDDTNYSESNALFYFEISTGEIINIIPIGSHPGFTTLTPDEDRWMVLSGQSVSLVPIEDPNYTANVTVTTGLTIGSSNIIFSQDSRYAFFAASSLDRILQLDLETNGIVGSYLVGDVPDESEDQPSGIAITPDTQTIVVLNAISNELDLLADATMLRVPEFVNDRDQFTGITLINLSDKTANLTLTAVNESGLNNFLLSGGTGVFDSVDPVVLPPLLPNAQLSLELSEIVNFNNTVSNKGHLEISSDQSAVVGFAVTGNIRATYLDAKLAGLNGMSLYRFPESLHDWIIPDIPIEEAYPAEFVFTNPNYNTSPYSIIHYGMDGQALEVNNDNELDPSKQTNFAVGDLFADSELSQVLIVGGRDAIARNWAEIYIPDEKFFSGTGYMGYARYGHAATLLDDGKVLISGGKDGAHIHKTAELYSVIYQDFFPITGTMIHERYRHTSTLLNDGKVLVAGGQNSISINATAELYDPETDTFSPTAGFMNSARDAHTGTYLPDGRVLLAGGIDGIGLSATAEVYNPATSTFSRTGSMSTGRAFHTAVLLKNGKVLITGGYDGNYLNSAELYNPATGVFEAIPSMNVARSNHTATMLEDGTVLIAGGENTAGALESAEIYYPSANQFALLSNQMTTLRSQHTATLLPDGNVLLVSGTNQSGLVENSEIFFAASQTFSSETASQTAQRGHTATLLMSPMAGYIRGSSERGVMFREHRGAATARIATNGIDVDRYAGITRIYSPRFVTRFPDRTILNLINANEDSDAIVTITLYDTDGNVIGTPVIRELPIDNQINDDLIDIFQNDPEIVGKEGWIEVVSSVDKVVGTISFGKSGGNILTTFDLSGTPLNEFIVPLAAENSDYRTGISLLNASGQSATVRLELRGETGAIDRSTSVTLPDQNGVEAFLGDYFPGLESRLYGYIRVSSNQPLHSFSILWDRNQKFGCAMSPIPIPEQ